LNLDRFFSASQGDAEQAAGRRAYAGNASLLLEPLYDGRYPEQLFDWIVSHQPQVRPGNLDLIRQPVDFLGINYYKTHAVANDMAGGVLKFKATPVSAPGWDLTQMGWGIKPLGLTAMFVDVKDRYGNRKVYITENGHALADVPDEAGRVAN
jgi:beta-glucosidase